jgi:branched-chain amino acid transport system substrate-binding protein
VVVGISLSLSGQYAVQGREILDGLRLWAEWVEARTAASVAERVRLVCEDDASRGDRARANVRRFLTEAPVDLLLGPYSTHLVAAAVPVVEEHGGLLWNHGGAGDACLRPGTRHVVHVLSPAGDYLRGLPAWARRRLGARRLVALVPRTGSFGASVARGLAEGARAEGDVLVRVVPFDPPVTDVGGLLGLALADGPDALVSAGAFRDDVAVMRHAAGAPGLLARAAVAAGVEGFHRELGPLAEGVVGPSPWEPSEAGPATLGPDAGWLVEGFRRRFGALPGYPAAQAVAAGVLAVECARRAGSLAPTALVDAALGLDAWTLYGRFRLDPATGRQVGHEVRLVQWRGGVKTPLRDAPAARP